MSRLYNLDYLRGLAAFGIMYYHFTLWTVGQLSVESFSGRFGIYGVSIFYILSGLTLFHVYSDNFVPFRSKFLGYIKRRALRIYPLFWIATVLSISITKKLPNVFDIFLNITGLFGFLRWDRYFSIVAWSIGNELVFYAFFPFFVIFSKKSKGMFFLLGLLFFIFFLYFSFSKLNTNLSLYKQWKNYINPLNQVFLFYCGYLTGYVFKEITVSKKLLFFLAAASLLSFIYFPASGNAINIVTGYSRLIFTGFSLIFCFCFYKLSVSLPGLIHQPLNLMGEASYSIYLLHPIIWTIIGVLWRYLNFSVTGRLGSAKFIVSIGVTLAISHFVYIYFEKYFISIGRRSAR